MPWEPPRGHARRSLGAALLLVLLLGAPALASANGPGPFHATAPTASAGLAPAPPALPFGGGPHRGGAPALTPLATSHEFYTQIGATLTQVNDSVSVTQLPMLAETITAVASPYPSGYELNLLSGTGDWYQVLVTDNWPGCNAGFEEATEVWDNQGYSGAVFCDPTVSIAQGDQVILNASLPNGATACLGLDDATRHAAEVQCVSQPNAGAGGFELLPTAANHNGYYTGTMTEIVNTSASSCPDYKLLPRVTFAFPSWAEVSEYVPWSDEFDALSALYCNGYSATPVYLPPNDPASQFLDATAGASDGPQIVMGQNDTPLVATVGFRFQSDPRPITSETITAGAPNVAPGAVDPLTAATQGGLAPYSTRWTLDGRFTLSTSNRWNFTSLTPGNYTIVAYGVDAQGDALASSPLKIIVPYPLKAAPPSLAPGPHVDVGQSVTFSAKTSGGLPPLTFRWTGLPAGCPALNASSISCSPTAPGNTTVRLTVIQGNGSSSSPAGLAVVVDPALRISIRATGTLGDVGQQVGFVASASGGSGGFTYAWYNLPGTCFGSDGQEVCALNTSGQFVVNAAVNDTNENSVGSSAIPFLVSPALSASFRIVPAIVDLGGPVALTATITGGSGGLNFTWVGLPASCPPADAATLDCLPTTTGSSSVTLTVTDVANATVPVPAQALRVYPDLAVALTPNATTVSTPGAFTLRPAELNGSPIANLTWLGLPPGCTPGIGLAPARCADLAPGNYTVAIAVTDEGGGSARASASVTVGPPVTPINPPPAPVDLAAYALVGIAVLGLLVAVAVAARRRRPPATGVPPARWDADGPGPR
jgi:hypothetical protein